METTSKITSRRDVADVVAWQKFVAAMRAIVDARPVHRCAELGMPCAACFAERIIAGEPRA